MQSKKTTVMTMNFEAPNDIISFPHTNNEIHSHNRNKTGYHVFVSVFSLQFNCLHRNEQTTLLINKNVHSRRWYHLHESNPILHDPPPISRIDRIRLAARHWEALGGNLKQAWNDRAVIINSLPVLGVFPGRPEDCTETIIVESLNWEFKRFASAFNQAVRKGGRFEESNMVRRFGDELVEIKDKVYKTFALSPMMRSVFFGRERMLEKLRRGERVKRTAKTTVIHINSTRRMEEIFLKQGVHPFEVKKDGKKFVSAGKVIFRKKKNKIEYIGYVIDEDDDGAFDVLMEVEGRNIRFPHLSWNATNGCFRMTRVHEEYDLIEYHPIRMIVTTNGRLSVLFKSICIDIDTGKLVHT